MKIGNMQVYGVIYKITNTVNGKIYIGQTTRYNGFNGRYPCKGVGIERVYKYHKNIEKEKGNCNVHLLNSIEKYGFSNFKVDEVFDVAFSSKELDIKEISYITLYKSNYKNFGYNITDGGAGGKHSEDSKSKKGNIVVCLNDNKEFKSLKEASQYYNIPTHYIAKAMRREFYSDYRNYKYFRFRKVKRSTKSSEKLCACCGKYFNLTYTVKSRRKDAEKIYNRSRKYCDKCKDRKYRETKDKNKKMEYGMKKFYVYNKIN